uniref:Uncharacterized protein n=1 Tax=Tanacetum cinerariifolium TaxID=118510 RepID=A0A6L2JDH4_TANCI|nr:hypothetical protein [Tanacetum cinerariifolium]
MENLPPSNNNRNVPEEEPILDQAPASLVGFAPQWIGGQIPNNNNGWQEEDPEEEPEEEEIENVDMVNNEEDDAEVINPYEEADPHNGPPPTFDEETEFVPPVSVHRGVKRLSKQMHDRYRTEKKMAKKLRQDKLRMNGQEFHITALDSAVRENRSKNSKMIKLITGLSREFTLRIRTEEPSIYTAPVPRADDPYVTVRDAAMDARGDEDVDTDAPWDTLPSEPRGSPRDS